MKFDIVRAWKDEEYRRTLDSEELKTLPENPAGELKDSQLARVIGGNSPDSAAAAAATTNWFGTGARRSHHTWAGLCDINLFSNVVPILAIHRLVVIGKTEKQVCAENS